MNAKCFTRFKLELDLLTTQFPKSQIEVFEALNDVTNIGPLFAGGRERDEDDAAAHPGAPRRYERRLQARAELPRLDPGQTGNAKSSTACSSATDSCSLLESCPANSWEGVRWVVSSPFSPGFGRMMVRRGAMCEAQYFGCLLQQTGFVVPLRPWVILLEVHRDWPDAKVNCKCCPDSVG